MLKGLLPQPLVTAPPHSLDKVLCELRGSLFFA